MSEAVEVKIHYQFSDDVITRNGSNFAVTNGHLKFTDETGVKWECALWSIKSISFSEPVLIDFH